MKKNIPYGRHDITDEDVRTVIEVLKSEFITQGPYVEKFENTVKNLVDSKYAVAVSSATSALHIACLACDLGPGDYLWTVPLTFLASANCGVYCGAKVDFVDIDPQTLQISIQALEKKLELAKKNNTLPKVLVPVHFAGPSCDMKPIFELSKKYGFKIIEDASHSIGGKYKDSFIGSCEYSHATVFSFHPVKIITSGEGGMVTCNDPEIHKKLLLFRSHGMTRNPTLFKNTPHGPWYYEQVALGFNYRITDVMSALAISQLNRLKSYVDKRYEYVKKYRTFCKKIGLEYQVHGEESSSYHLFVIRVPAEKRKEIFEFLSQSGLGVNVHYIPVHTQPYYQEMGFKWGDFPVSENYYKQAITLPLFPTMTEEDFEYVCEKVTEALKTFRA